MSALERRLVVELSIAQLFRDTSEWLDSAPSVLDRPSVLSQDEGWKSPPHAA
jgi:hypothetical protein